MTRFNYEGDLRLYLSGGPGSGCSTLGEALSRTLTLTRFDSDDYFHKPSTPPFQEQYSPSERNGRLLADMAKVRAYVLCGSISTWGINSVSFTHSVLLNVGKDLRMRRLKRREAERLGHRLREGGDMYDDHLDFIEWASHYETGHREGRSLPIERVFLRRRGGRVLEICSAQSVDELATACLEHLRMA